MTPDEVKKIIKEEDQRNYLAGVPRIAPHTHNGVDNLPINAADILGLSPGSSLEVTDGTVDVTGVDKIEFPSGSVTDNGDGDVSIAFSGGGTPGGFGGDIQLNDGAGAFDAFSGFTPAQYNLTGLNTRFQLTPSFDAFQIFNIGGITLRQGPPGGYIIEPQVVSNLTIIVGESSNQTGDLYPGVDTGPGTLTLQVINADHNNGLLLNSDGYGINLNTIGSNDSAVSVTGGTPSSDPGGVLIIGGIGNIPDTTLTASANTSNVTNSIILKQTSAPTSTPLDDDGNGAAVIWLDTDGDVKIRGSAGTVTVIGPA